ncbi:MAG: hypothetical protein ACXVCD_15700, partial [Pseudobdellovibrionaceae bacterium]
AISNIVDKMRALLQERRLKSAEESLHVFDFSKRDVSFKPIVLQGSQLRIYVRSVSSTIEIAIVAVT